MHLKRLIFLLAIALGLGTTSHTEAQTFVPVNMPPAILNSMAIDVSGQIYLATSSGTYLSSNQGKSWILGDSSTYGTLFVSVASNGWVLELTWFDSLRVSLDRGKTWTTCSVKLWPPVLTAGVTRNGTILASAVGSGLMRSTDTGAIWKPAAGIDTNTALNLNYVQAPNGDLFGAAYGIFRSSDDGATWTHSVEGVIDTAVQCVAVTANGHVFAGSSSGILRSIDNGDTWSADGLQPLSDIWRLAAWEDNVVGISKLDSLKPLVISQDEGTTWKHLAVPQLGIEGLAIDSSGYVYVFGIPGADSIGIYRSPVPATALAVAGTGIASADAILVYPNPVVRSASISYHLTSPEWTSLKVYNARGEIVTTLAEGMKTAGNHVEQFSAGNFPAGVYWYRLTHGSQTETGKMVVIN